MNKSGNKNDVRNDPTAFRQQVRMAAVQVAGLRPEELTAALAYEVEPFSGIPADEAEVAYEPVEDADPSIRVYEVAVRRRTRGTGGRGGLERHLKPAVVVGCALLALVGIDFGVMAVRTARLEKVVARQGLLDAQVNGVRNAARQKREEIRAIREGRQAAERAQDAAARLRAAYAEMLSEIAAACETRAVVKSIGGGARQIVLRAVGLSTAAAAETIENLSLRAAKCGWRLETGPIAVQGTGPMANFECVLSHD